MIKKTLAISAMCAATCGIVLASAALAQDAASAEGTTSSTPADDMADDVWSVAGETRDYTIFVAQGTVEGPPTARKATGMMVLEEPNEQGVGAQQTHYVFDCARERYTETGFTFVMADGFREIPQPAPNEEKRWRDDQVAKSVGELACGDAWTVQTFKGFEEAFAEAAR